MSVLNPSEYGYCNDCLAPFGQHKTGCPNDTSLPEKAGNCDICGEAVFADEERYCIDGVLCHTECFDDKYKVTP